MTPKQILDDVREALEQIEDHHNETDDWRDIAREAIAKLDTLKLVEGTMWIFCQPTDVDDRPALLLTMADEADSR